MDKPAKPGSGRKAKKAALTTHPLFDRKLKPFLDGVFKEAGFGECTRLCDVSTVQRVCGELLPGAFEWLSETHGLEGSHPLVEDLDALLIEPLIRYGQQLETAQTNFNQERDDWGLSPHGLSMELAETIDFIEVAQDVQESLRLGPWVQSDCQACAAALELAWYRWIATIATPYLTFKVPVAIARARAAPALSKSGAPPGRRPKLDAQRVFARCQELEQLIGRAGTAGVVAREFDCSATRVRVIWREQEAKQKNETKPAG